MASAQTASFKLGDLPLTIGFNLYPDALGSDSQLQVCLGWNATGDFDSRLSGRYRSSNSSETNTIPATDISLLATQENTWRINADLLRWHFVNQKDFRSWIGLGVAWLEESTSQQGTWSVGADNENFRDDTVLDLLSPRLLAGLDVHSGKDFVCTLDLAASPLYWFNIQQRISIKPAITNIGQGIWNGLGSPQLEANLDLRLFSLIGINTRYEYDHLQVTSLQVNTAGNGWSAVPTLADLSRLTITGSLIFDLGGLRGSAGAGAELLWTAQNGGVPQLTSRLVGRFSFDN